MKNTTPGISFLSTEALKLIETLLANTYHGRLALTIQNFRLMQVERQEKFNLDELNKRSASTSDGFQVDLLAGKINTALCGLEFGEIVITVSKGRLSRIERVLKERFSDLSGLTGEGI